jgi:hypothetical protein
LRLGSTAANAFMLRAVTAIIVQRPGLLNPSIIQIVADSFALEADKIKAVDAFIDLFPVKNAPSKLLYTDTQKFFIILLYFAPTRFVTWKILIFRFVVSAVIDILMGSVFAGATGALFFRSWHFGFD